MKERLDKLIFQRGFTESREKAAALIMANMVLVEGVPVDKSGKKIETNSELTIKEKPPYVSRGGYKLEGAVKFFGINFNNSICMDIGASTGGFTDVMIQNGASEVYAIDVGYNLIHEKLKACDKVINIEKTNFRNMEFNKIDKKVDYIVSDVSFISLKHIIPNTLQFLKKGSRVLLLIKPQFEVGRKFVSKGGIVRDTEAHIECIKDVISYALSSNLYLRGLAKSPIKGTKGNEEYLALLDLEKHYFDDVVTKIREVVENGSYICS